MTMLIDEEALSPEVMLVFYRRLYPFKSIFHWLNHEHGPRKLFTNREFAFTLKGDVYLRYQSFTTADELKKQVCTMNPTRFEIGPMYTARVRGVLLYALFVGLHDGVQPRDKKLARPGAFQPELRELVFDIDMTDYDSIRTCCSGADICSRCWAFIAVAVKVIDRSIRDDFGYQHLLWVYSGRRGIHLWISDRAAMSLTDDQRRSLVAWMTVIQGSKDQHKKVNVRVGSKPLPPTLKYDISPPHSHMLMFICHRESIATLAQAFTDIILINQDCFRSEEGWKELLHLVPKDFVDDLSEIWSKQRERSSEDKWKDIKKLVKANSEAGRAQRVSHESSPHS